MKVLVTGFNREKKIQAIKGVRAVARAEDLKTAKNFVEGPLPAELECLSGLTWEAIERTLGEHGVAVLCTDENAALLQFLAALPDLMSVGELRATLGALHDFKLPGAASV